MSALLAEAHLRGLTSRAESLTHAFPSHAGAAGVLDDLGLRGLKRRAQPRQFGQPPPLPRVLVERVDPFRSHLGDVLLVRPGELAGVQVQLVNLGVVARVDVGRHRPAAVESAGDGARVRVRHGVKSGLTFLACQVELDDKGIARRCIVHDQKFTTVCPGCRADQIAAEESA